MVGHRQPRLYSQVRANVTLEFTVYSYQPLRLWLVCGTAFVVTDMYGHVCVIQNGGAMQRSFSSIAAPVRDRDLDALLTTLEELLPARAENIKLRFRSGGFEKGEKAGLTIAESLKGVGDVEMSLRMYFIASYVVVGQQTRAAPKS
ncbi:unnamed protein product [Peniophora sp. CBMAI 1063]|nr:unnamed protein product [Peniophora sp. CBMAI 1063]